MPDSLSSTLNLLPSTLVDVFSRAKVIPFTEVAYVWSRRRSFGTYLFVLNRYLPFIDLTLSLYGLNTAGIEITQGILVLRTIAIWERNRWVCGILAVVITGTAVSAIVSSKLYLDSLYFVEENPDFFFGCVLKSSNKMIVISFIAILISETSKHPFRSSLSTASDLKHRSHLRPNGDTSSSTFAPIKFILGTSTLQARPQRALHSMLCNRVIFIILSVQREQDESDSGDINSLSRRQDAGTESGIVLSTILDTFATLPDDRASEIHEIHHGI
ncbi:hypothetical protein CVT25_002388 [Psilocybe cyanescens]|uniref:DUF6533 domain-containing protein n=1 Tax=Psilocybe cyanescens TaxID=93625 RepID=A0A409WKF5_PSICY|nr:hypothetical protein CVT25_002388 [Psilocybe cyanescens]